MTYVLLVAFVLTAIPIAPAFAAVTEGHSLRLPEAPRSPAMRLGPRFDPVLMDALQRSGVKNPSLYQPSVKLPGSKLKALAGTPKELLPGDSKKTLEPGESTAPTKRKRKSFAKSRKSRFTPDLPIYLQGTSTNPDLPRLTPPGVSVLPPRAQWSRVSTPGSPYREVKDPVTVSTFDHQIFYKETIELSNPVSENIRWDFRSPDTSINQTSFGTAATVVFDYVSVGEDAEDPNASYTLTVSVYDRDSLNGRIVSQETQPGYLEVFEPYCGITARDVGDWDLVRISSGGAEVSRFTVVDALTEVTDSFEEGDYFNWYRRTNDDYAFSGDFDGYGYTSDEYLVNLEPIAISDFVPDWPPQGVASGSSMTPRQVADRLWKRTFSSDEARIRKLPVAGKDFSSKPTHPEKELAKRGGHSKKSRSRVKSKNKRGGPKTVPGTKRKKKTKPSRKNRRFKKGKLPRWKSCRPWRKWARWKALYRKRCRKRQRHGYAYWNRGRGHKKKRWRKWRYCPPGHTTSTGGTGTTSGGNGAGSTTTGGDTATGGTGSTTTGGDTATGGTDSTTTGGDTTTGGTGSTTTTGAGTGGTSTTTGGDTTTTGGDATTAGTGSTTTGGDTTTGGTASTTTTGAGTGGTSTTTGGTTGGGGPTGDPLGTFLVNWYHSDDDYNVTQLDTYYTAEYTVYEMDGLYEVERVVYDVTYPEGRSTGFEDLDAAQEELLIVQAGGLIAPGVVNTEYVFNGGVVTVALLEFREHGARLANRQSTFQSGSDNVFSFDLRAEPSSWNPSAFTAKLLIVEADTQELLYEESRSFTSPVPSTVDFVWNGKDLSDEFVPPGVRICADLELLTVDDPFASREAPKALASTGPVVDTLDFFRVAQVTPLGPIDLTLPPLPVTYLPDEREEGNLDPRCIFGSPALFGVRSPALSSSLSHLPHQVDPTTGNARAAYDDLVIPTRGLPIMISRYHETGRQNFDRLQGWRWSFHRRLKIRGVGIQYLKPNGDVEVYKERISDGAFIPDDPSVTSRLEQLNLTTYQLTLKNGIKYTFERPLSGNSINAVLVKEEDRNGNANTYTWDDFGLTLEKIADPAGREVTFSWNSPPVGQIPLLETVTDWTNRTVTYDYLPGLGTDNLLDSATLPDGTRLGYAYLKLQCPYTPGNGNYALIGGTLNNQAGNTSDLVVSPTPRVQGVTTGGITRAQAIDGARTSLSGLRTQTSSGPPQMARFGSNVGRQEWSFQTNVRGRATSITDPLQQLTQFDYDGADNVTQVVDALQNGTILEWDARRNPTRVVDRNGNITAMTWNTNDDVTRIDRVGSPSSQVTLFTYDSNRNPLTIQDPEGHVTFFSYNNFGQVVLARDNLNHETTFTYDGNGYLATITDPENRTTTFVNDALGRRTRVTDARGNRWDYVYDSLDRITSVTQPGVGGALPTTSEWTWNQDGTLQEFKDANGNITKYTYDEALRLLSVEMPTTDTTRYEYDALGNLTKLINPNDGETLYQYDDLNRVTRITYPGGDQEGFSYDAVGNTRVWTKGDNSTVNYTYDPGYRMTRLQSGPTNITYGYDQFDRLTTMTDGTGTTTWDYNLNSLVTEVVYPGSRSVQYDYDGADRRTRVTSSSGAITSYTWTDRNQLLTATQDGQTFTYGYDFNQNLTAVTYPNGVTCGATYDERNRLTGLEYVNGASPITSFSYTFDEVGNRTNKTQILPTKTVSEDYQYDTRYQVTEVSRATDGGTPEVISMTYDPNGNRTSRSGVNFAHNVADQLVTSTAGAALTYLATGSVDSLTNSGVTQEFAYDYRDMPVSVTVGAQSASYSYNGINQRMARTELDGTSRSYVWDGSELLTEYEGAAVKADYLLGVFREGIRTSDGWRFYLRDGLGSTVGLVDENGDLTDSYEYSVFGELLPSSTGSSYNPFLFSGEQFDADLGQYYLRNRYYAPTLGRFLVRDPIRYEGGQNLYMYAANNPILYVDPLGLDISIDWRQDKDDPLTQDEALMIAGMLPVVGTGVAVVEFAANPGFWTGMGVALGLVPGGRAGKVVVKTASDDLLKAATRQYKKTDITVSGRALAKHKKGSRSASSPFPEVKGSNQAVSDAAEQVVHDILEDPGSIVKISPWKGEPAISITRPNGQGALWTFDKKNWIFRGFRE